MSRSRQARMRLTGLAFVLVLGGLTVLAFSGVYRKPFEPKTRTVVADFDHAAQLHKGDQVRLNGDIEGKVTDVQPSPVRDAARVTMAVDDDSGPLYADARARLKEKTLLGGAFYVALERGTPGTGKLGRTVIPLDRTTVQTEIEDLTDVFRAGAVSGMQTIPPELARALAQADKPVGALQEADDVAHDASVAVYAVRGRRPGEDLPRLIRSTARAVSALDTPTDDARELVAGAATTLATTGRRSQEIQQLLAAGPGVTHDLTFTLRHLDGTLGLARNLIDRLEVGVPQIAPTLAALRPTLPLATSTLRNNTPLLQEVGNAIRAGGRAGQTVAPLLRSALPALRRTDRTILPYFARKDPVTGYSTTVMTGGFLAGFAGVAAQQDQNGHYVRFSATAGTEAAYLPCSSNLVDPSAKATLACDTFDTALKTYLGYAPPLTATPSKAGAR